MRVFLEDREVLAGDITTKPIGDGHSNLTFLVSDGTRSVVVRRPPPPPIPPGAHDMLREAKLLSALSSSPVPVPEVLAVAQAGEVLDVPPFYVMSFADGHVVTTTTPSPLATTEDRRSIGHSMIDTLAELHAVDWRAAGLEKMGRPEGFNARHLQRMRRLVVDDNDRVPEAFADVDSWLQENTPPESGGTLIHCDFRIGNVVIAPDSPGGRVAAVLDWELATIGDPLLDVGYFLATVPSPGLPMNPHRRAQCRAAGRWVSVERVSGTAVQREDRTRPRHSGLVHDIRVVEACGALRIQPPARGSRHRRSVLHRSCARAAVPRRRASCVRSRLSPAPAGDDRPRTAAAKGKDGRWPHTQIRAASATAWSVRRKWICRRGSSTA